MKNGYFDSCIIKKSNKNVWKEDKSLKNNFYKIIEEINQNSNLPYKLIEDYPKSTNRLSNVKLVRNFMSKDIYHKNYVAFFAGYPTDEHSKKLTKISLKNSSSYNILGIKIGDVKEECIKILESFGFEEIDNFDIPTPSTHIIIFKKLDFEVNMKFNDNILENIELSIQTYCLGNKIY